MKCRSMSAGVLFLVLFFVIGACSSTPPAEEEAVSPPPETPAVQTPEPAAPAAVVPESVSQDMIDALNTAKALADTNRTLSLEVDGPEYFPNEWNAAESRYVRANGSEVANTNAAYQSAVDSYNGIAADFEDIAADALPLYAEKFRKDITEARSAAIEAGILNISPERFQVAEDYAVSAEAAWEAEDYETAITLARNALPRYKALKTGADAYNVRVNIENHRFAYYDRTAIDAVDEEAFRAVIQYDEGDIAGVAAAEKVLSEYTMIYKVLNTASDAYDVRMAIEDHRFASYDRTAIDAADADAFLALDQYKKADAAAVTTVEKVLSEYNTINDVLNTASDAYDVRLEIDYWINMAIDNEPYLAGMGIEYGDISSYATALNEADEAAYRAIDQYERGDAGSALVSAQEALSEYNTLMSQAWVDASGNVANVAANAQRTAVNAKAPVAAKQEYDRAYAGYIEGQAFLNVKDYQSAAISYYESIVMFKEAAEVSEYKRQHAQEAISEAERKIAESERTAADAETRLEGGAQ